MRRLLGSLKSFTSVVYQESKHVDSASISTVMRLNYSRHVYLLSFEIVGIQKTTGGNDICCIRVDGGRIGGKYQMTRIIGVAN
ncbi:hypothetical protein TNIN_99391 [Trichonephila inaurata madagascariensis]|uniref:Uncharacterized protein n=1 Tax=Trichonephila inaurata madagascariensis TaxID=2747483 RepID=A0A8X6M9I6_9ARAC|nr:hypothetical protein TNIN_222051 [Trichonephila inaurata madagascariensis]GFS34813.1 hypothetical protein TNIN_99391 [Trichonephila inaurata madagascariensis]